jgi:ABC-type branched-subunit amino acid transport system ATPase component
MALLTVEDLVVGYGPHPVLHGISFEVQEVRSASCSG